MPLVAHRRIRLLPDEVVNQIAAGEVVERPASVVKELVENALDAGATRVDVAIRNGGRTDIRVADDGTGMGSEDATLALDRHATSKISAVEDLPGVATFGFRGEALPSIASVSRFTLETAEAGGVGTRVRADAGRVVAIEPCARQPGTTVRVAGLFRNVPARAAFLRSAAAEARAVSAAVTTLALAHLSCAFRLTSNDRELLDLPAAGSLVERVGQLWGEETASTFVPAAAEASGIRVAGLVERPDSAARAAARRVHLFVGGRPFRDPGVAAAAERAYRTTVPDNERAKPSLLLYLAVGRGDVDVNVHPTKAEVRFRDRGAVEEVVEQAVRGALAGLDSAAPLGRAGPLSVLGEIAPPPATREPAAEPARDAEAQLGFLGGAATRPPHVREGGDPGWQGDRGEPASTPQPAGAGASGSRGIASGLHDRGMGTGLWQLNDTYIVAQTRGGLLLVDQHSAHERVLFEETMLRMEEGGAEVQSLLFPLTLRLGPAEFEVVEQSASILARAGFEIQPFGGRTVLVTGVPAAHPRFDPERCLRDMIAELAEGSALTRAARNQHERIAMTFACKGAIKAGERLDDREMEELFDRLFATELPAHDVHGRPTIVRISMEELARRFGRG
ncbi:MAG TPA: DNA mismatch repair endonuclease MutL [Longimicrobiales bacterium]|nr:DNA mismatch repair endonuclease MutL [Longimicrobiales bacterium]